MSTFESITFSIHIALRDINTLQELIGHAVVSTDISLIPPKCTSLTRLVTLVITVFHTTTEITIKSKRTDSLKNTVSTNTFCQTGVYKNVVNNGMIPDDS